MNKSLIVVPVVLIVACVWLALRFFNGEMSSPDQQSAQGINRAATPGHVQGKVDQIFKQIEWDRNIGREIQRTSGPADTAQVIDARAKTERMTKELSDLGPSAYPAIIEYAICLDQVQSDFASRFIRNMEERAVDPLMVAIGSSKVAEKNRRSLISLTRNAVRQDFELLEKFLKSKNVVERRVASEIIAEVSKRDIDRAIRYGYRSPRHAEKSVLPLSYRPELIALIKSESDEQTRVNLVTILSGYGEDNEEIKGDLITLFNDEKNVDVKISMANLLGGLAYLETTDGAVETMKTLTDALKVSKSAKLRHAIIDSLKLAPEKFSAETVQVVLEATGDSIASVGQDALQALCLAAKTNSDCLPIVERRALDQNDKKTVAVALESVSYVDSNEEKAKLLPRILKLAESESNGSSACSALAKMGSDVADEAVPVLRKIISSGERMDKRAAIGALGSMGPKAKEAIPELKQLAESSDSARYEAKRLLKTFGIEQ